MIEPKITTLETARMLDETTTLLSNMAGACDYLCCTTALISHSDQINNNICGVFGVLSYAADAAHTKQENYQFKFMEACGFVQPLLVNCPEVNRQRDTVIPFPRKSSY